MIKNTHIKQHLKQQPKPQPKQKQQLKQQLKQQSKQTQPIEEIILKNGKTMVDINRLNNLANSIKKFRESKTPYSFVECGVAQGGCLAFMKHCLVSYNQNGHKIFGFDSFEGMPSVSKEDCPEVFDGAAGDPSKWVGYNCSKYGEQAVHDTFKLLNLPMDNVFIVKGYFENTLEKHIDNIGEIAVLRLDNDWYSSTKYCLELLYDKVIKGGVILIDDYGAFDGCKKAVDEFREKNNITSPIKVTNQRNEHYWYKGN